MNPFQPHQVVAMEEHKRLAVTAAWLATDSPDAFTTSLCREMAADDYRHAVDNGVIL